MNFIRKYGLTILGLLFAGGSFLIETKQISQERDEIKSEVEEDIITMLRENKIIK